MSEKKELTPRQFLDYIKSFKRICVKYDINKYSTMIVGCKPTKVRMFSSVSGVQYLQINDGRENSSFYFTLGGKKFFVEDKDEEKSNGWIDVDVATDCSDITFEFSLMK